MKYLLKNVTIIDSNSSFNGKKADILIDENCIEKISLTGLSLLEREGEEYDFEGSIVTNGFCDLYTNSGDPGFEYREDIRSVANAAIAGGFTTICATADNFPISQSKAQIEYVLNNAKNTAVQILPIGAVTENFDGKSPTEMYDMHTAGAVAFSDIPHSISDSGVLLRALQYVQQFDGLVIVLPFDKTLVGEGQVNESEISVRMGMKGISNLSEYAIVQRDIELLKYSGGKLHFAGISTEESVALIRQAKKQKLPVTCSVFVHHLISTEKEIHLFNTNYKVFPPLRNDEDQRALMNGIKDGTIDCIATQHTPLNIDSKNVEFEYADFGMIALETAFGLLNKKLSGIISVEQLIELLSSNPRAIIKHQRKIESGEIADLCLINVNEEWQLEEQKVQSKSTNSPYIGIPLKGKVKAVFSKGYLIKND